MNSQTTKIVTAAKGLLKACGYFADNLWHIDDVHFICEQLELPAINDDEAMDVFAIASEQFEGETGISWPKLEEALKQFLQRKQAINTMLEKSGFEASGA